MFKGVTIILWFETDIKFQKKTKTKLYIPIYVQNTKFVFDYQNFVIYSIYICSLVVMYTPIQLKQETQWACNAHLILRGIKEEHFLY